VKYTIALAALACAAAGGAVLPPYELECEARRNPVGIDAAQPRLSWKLRSEAQAAYQIQAGTSPDASGIWDSGRIPSPETSWIAYSGPNLESFRRYWWRVRVWNAAGEPSPWSDAAEWTQVPASASGWKGGWIAHPDHSLRSGPLPIFRKELVVDKPLRRAIALVAGAGFHELRINGQKVGDHVLAPAWSNFRSTVYYESFDVTALLTDGANAIGVLLGNGFYNVAGGRYTKFTGSFGQPRVRVHLHLEYQDGTLADIATDGTWRVTDGPITFSCIYGGEDYDARREPAGWDRPGFDDSVWRRASGMEAPGGELRAQSSPPIRVQQTFRPVKVSQPKPGVVVYDLGQNFAGWPRITASGAAGTEIRMTPGELLDPAGLVSQRSSGGPVSFNYTLRGAGEETWSPRFSYYGFRYVQVEGAAALRSLEGEFIHLDARRTGEFSCSNDRLNKIHALIDAAVRSNLQHSLTDCPHREKLGWLEQFHLMGPALLYDWDLRTYLPKIVRDMREAQTIDGLVPDIAPEYVVFGGGFRDSPEWGSTAFQLPWLAWQIYGDRTTLAEGYRTMKAYDHYLNGKLQDGLLSYGLGDWYDIGPRPPGNSQLTPQGVTASALYWSDLKVMESAARVLGYPTGAHDAADAADRLAAAFQKAYWKDASYATGSQTSLAMPLALGLAPAGARQGLAEKLVADIRAHGNHTTAGDIGYCYVLRALMEASRGDVVYDMAVEETAPSYAGQIARGATSLTEAWDANPNSSQNHLMLGHIEEWFYAGLAGIRPQDPGLRHIEIRPQPVGDLTWVKARWETFRGPVAVEWKRDGRNFHLQVSLPPGMTAGVVLPGAAAPPKIASGESSFNVVLLP
jgi:hypothetical protein